MRMMMIMYRPKADARAIVAITMVIGIVAITMVIRIEGIIMVEETAMETVTVETTTAEGTVTAIISRTARISTNSRALFMMGDTSTTTASSGLVDATSGLIEPKPLQRQVELQSGG